MMMIATAPVVQNAQSNVGGNVPQGNDAEVVQHAPNPVHFTSNTAAEQETELAESVAVEGGGGRGGDGSPQVHLPGQGASWVRSISGILLCSPDLA